MVYASMPLALLPGAPELIAIVVVALLIFGNRLPELGRSLGRTIVEFKKGVKDVGQEIDRSETKESDKLPPPKNPV